MKRKVLIMIDSYTCDGLLFLNVLASMIPWLYVVRNGQDPIIANVERFRYDNIKYYNLLQNTSQFRIHNISQGNIGKRISGAMFIIETLAHNVLQVCVKHTDF